MATVQTTRFTKANMASVRQSLQSALDAVCKTEGIKSISIGTIRFTDVTFSCKLTAINHGQPAGLLPSRGLEHELIGKSFTMRGYLFTVQDGKRFKFTESMIKHCMQNPISIR